VPQPPDRSATPCRPEAGAASLARPGFKKAFPAALFVNLKQGGARGRGLIARTNRAAYPAAGIFLSLRRIGISSRRM